ncbi:hypothetical protein HMPREF1982_00260 [Clostridiales bacterium oral taxon 876 str. F0540]|nr:hypothetical protein HMPREF1982_00260 [Clostridiales bacterium oral taxon 876 str. F0540]
MSIEFSEIYNKIKKQYPAIDLLNEINNCSLKDIRFITKASDLEQKDILYVGKASQLEGIKSNRSLGNFIIYNDCNDNVDGSFTNIAEVKDEEDLYTAFNLIKDMFIKDIKVSNPASTLLKSLAQGKGLKYLLKIGAETLNNPIILIDANFSIISYSNNKNISDELWSKNIQTGYCSYEFIAEVQKLKSVRNSPSNNEPFMVTCEASPIRRFVSKVMLNSKFIGYLLLLECGDTITEDHLELFKVLNSAITEELKNNSLYGNIKGLKYENLIYDLLEGKIDSEEIARERMKNAECYFGNNLFVLTISLSEYTLKSTHGKSLKDNIEKLLVNAKSVFYKEDIVILVDIKDNKINNKEFLINIEDFLDNNKLKAAVSGKFSKLIDMKNNYLDSKKALSISKSLSRTNNFIKYDDYKFYALLDTISGDIKKYCHPAVLRLIEFDKNNSTDYFETLKTFLINNQNANLTSEKLFIHRNTLNYRIAKIKEIIGLELKDSEEIFNISYTYKLLEFLGVQSLS